MKKKIFLELTDKEEARLKWLVGFFVGHHIVEPTFRNRKDWDEERIIKELQGDLFSVVFSRFVEWMKQTKQNRLDDVMLLKKIETSKEMKEEVKRCLFDKIPPLAKEKNYERFGCASKRLSKRIDGWEEVLSKFENVCAYCGSASDLSIDHVVPTSKLGKHVKNNVVPACRSCNSSKSNKDLEEWYPTKYFFDNKRYTKILSHIRG